MRRLSKLVPRSAGGRWAAGIGLAGVAAVGIYLVFFVFAFHLVFVDEVVDEKAPEFASEADVDELISEALDAGPTTTTAAAVASADGAAATPPDDGGSDDGGAADDDDAARGDDGPDDSSQGDGSKSDTEVRVAHVGSFGPRSHPAEGAVVVLTDGTQTILRFDDSFATDNGPDLNVYLHSAGSDASVEDLAADFIDLGDLKGNIGAQNYLIDDVDLDRYSTVSVWCVRFRVVFGTAALSRTG